MTKFNTLRRITKILVDVSAIVCYAGIGYFFYKIAPVIADFLVTVTK